MAFVSEIATEVGAMGIDLADAMAVRSSSAPTTGRGTCVRTCSTSPLLLPVLESLRLFDVYRAVECPLLIYICTRIEPMPQPGADEVMSAYRRGLARELKALEAERPNVRVRTLDATHGVIFEMPEEVARDILSLTP